MTRRLPLAARHGDGGASLTTVWDVELPARFADDPAREHRHVRERAGLVDGSYRAVIDLAGDEAPNLLERISSNSSGRLSPGSGQHSCILTAKGRLVAAFALFRLAGGEYRIILGEPSRPEVVNELEKYALLSGVEVTDRSDSVSLLSLLGPRSRDAIGAAGHFRELPDTPFDCVAGEVAGRQVSVVRVAGLSPEGYEIWAAARDLPAIWDELREGVGSVGGGPVGWTALESLRLEAGLALHGLDYEDDSFPSEVGWEHALTFDKCYVGQEIVARMRTYGQANRKLFQVFPAGEQVVPAGSRLVVGDREVGEITSSGYSYFHGAPLALGRVKRRFWGDGSIAVEVGGGRRPVRLEELPGRRGGTPEGTDPR